MIETIWIQRLPWIHIGVPAVGIRANVAHLHNVLHTLQCKSVITNFWSERTRQIINVVHDSWQLAVIQHMMNLFDLSEPMKRFHSATRKIQECRSVDSL